MVTYSIKKCIYIEKEFKKIINILYNWKIFMDKFVKKSCIYMLSVNKVGARGI